MGHAGGLSFDPMFAWYAHHYGRGAAQAQAQAEAHAQAQQAVRGCPGGCQADAQAAEVSASPHEVRPVCACTPCKGAAPAAWSECQPAPPRPVWALGCIDAGRFVRHPRQRCMQCRTTDAAGHTNIGLCHKFRGCKAAFVARGDTPGTWCIVVKCVEQRGHAGGGCRGSQDGPGAPGFRAGQAGGRAEPGPEQLPGAGCALVARPPSSLRACSACNLDGRDGRRDVGVSNSTSKHTKPASRQSR